MYDNIIKVFNSSADTSSSILPKSFELTLKRLLLPLLLLTVSASASAEPDVSLVQRYCSATALPLMQAAADSVNQDSDNRYNELSITLAQKVFASQIYKDAPINVQHAMMRSLGNDVLVKEKKDKFIKMYMDRGENFLSALATLWAHYSVEPYLIECGYMKFSG